MKWIILRSRFSSGSSSDDKRKVFRDADPSPEPQVRRFLDCLCFTLINMQCSTTIWVCFLVMPEGGQEGKIFPK